MDAQVQRIVGALCEEYPDAQCELNHKTPFQLLIATVLSAQTTDVKVNQVTAPLFEGYPTLDEFLTLSQEEIETAIKKLGLYRNKAKNIYLLCRQLKENFNGEVPQEMKDLVSLAGVGRKTANVVMSNCFDYPAIAVDTHVFRVSNRIGLAKAKDVLATEKQLMEALDKEIWTLMHHVIIFHGRRCCSARKPECHRCVVREYCHYYKGLEKMEEK